MTRDLGHIFIGTSGWVYNHWRGHFYPNTLPTTRWLEYYSEHFRSVEVNNAFYKLPSKTTLQSWRDHVPDDFLFAVKASSYITHAKKLKDPEQSVARFLDHVGVLGDKLGPILFQLPPRWHYNPDRLAAFLDTLPGEFRYAFEFRDHSWLNPDTRKLLKAHNAAWCIYHLEGFQSPKEVTSDFVYVRLHGSGDAYQGGYDNSTLAGWAGAISSWLERDHRIFCYFNNDQDGHAPRNAGSLQSMLLHR